MISLAIVCLILLCLPFILAYIHTIINKKMKSVITYYRYFMTFNMIISGLFVTVRMFFDGPHAASLSGWSYSPIYHLYAIAILSMVILGLLTIYNKRIIMLAPAMCWSVFLVLSSISHIYQIYYHQIKIVPVIFIHIAYNLLVSLILFRYIYIINSLFEKLRSEKQSAPATN